MASHSSNLEDGVLNSDEAKAGIAIETTINTTSSLEDLQTEEQRQVLDTVAQLRKCGLEGVLSLPQLVVCGDQSSGKSSVLEALTEIPFPRNDNLCTRFATEIILRRAPQESLVVKVIPDSTRPAAEQSSIKSFAESIMDFSQLPDMVNKAMAVMGLEATAKNSSTPRAFARDTLSIEIEGPSRPQLTLVDIPGLIQSETKGVTKKDIDVVEEITDHYISQPRTICLAVISAAHDYANQGILSRVRTFDPDGERTLGIITKPDMLPAGSGSEFAFLELAQNQDVFFKLGWHVIKNRKFEESKYSFDERNASEATYFRKSAFSSLPAECLGIVSLRARLSALLFDHVKNELPHLRSDLDGALLDTQQQMDLLGDRRTTATECRNYLTQLSLKYMDISKAAVDGHYEGAYFQRVVDPVFSVDSPATLRRFRAVIQHLNMNFADDFRKKGHKYYIDFSNSLLPGKVEAPKPDGNPIILSKEESLNWAQQVLTRTRGKELVGNYNPLLIGELFWEQSSKWEHVATTYVDRVAQICSKFLDHLFRHNCPGDVHSRLWSVRITDALNNRNSGALSELSRLVEDARGHPINYNHYYTTTVRKVRMKRFKAALTTALENATQHSRLDGCQSNHTSASIDVGQAVQNFQDQTDPNMDNLSCEEALDCLLSIYKTLQKTFVANVTTQIIERHLVRGLEKLFTPVEVNSMSDAEIERVAAEPASAKRQREFLQARMSKLEFGNTIFRQYLGGA